MALPDAKVGHFLLRIAFKINAPVPDFLPKSTHARKEFAIERA